MKPELIVETPVKLAHVFADRFAALAREAIAARGRFSCALPGGSVADTFFPVVAGVPLPWDKVDFFWGDERAVGPDDPDSNYGLAKRLLLDLVHPNPARVHRIRGEAGDLEAAARAYEGELMSALGDPLQLDMVVLGVGPDGHVCSLFPGHALLHERQRLVAPITDSPKPPPRRVTFTVLPLELARTTCVVGFGAPKAAAIRDALENPDSSVPVALALRAARHAIVLVDPPAANLLRKDSASCA